MKYLLLINILLSSCNSKKHEIILSKTLSYDLEIPIKDTSLMQKSKRDVYIIRNPPFYKSKALEMANIHQDSLKKYDDSILKTYDEYYRAYYLESRKTPIDYAEDPGGFSTDVLDQHIKDFVLECYFSNGTVLIKDYTGFEQRNYYKKYDKREFIKDL